MSEKPEDTAAARPYTGGSRRSREIPLLARGTAIGRYVVLERVGAGGMGVVYGAFDPELDRRVAIKVLLDEDTSEDVQARQRRLLREARAMARLAHPNVITVHDVGTFEGRVFLAMEFVAGPNLSAWL